MLNLNCCMGFSLVVASQGYSSCDGRASHFCGFSYWGSKGFSRQWHPTPVLLPGKSHGRRSLVGCSSWGREESDTTDRLHFYFSLSCIGEGNGNPLQYSCLENPRDGGAWWAALYGVAQSRTRLKRLSSSSRLPHFWAAELIVNEWTRCWKDGKVSLKYADFEVLVNVWVEICPVGISLPVISLFGTHVFIVKVIAFRCKYVKC